MSTFTAEKVESTTQFTGSCTCRLIRYRLLAAPLFVHCCHCFWCQRESGSAFAVNAIIEASNVELLTDTEPEIVHTPSESGEGQNIARCRTCRVALWSNYGGKGDIMRFLKVGTLDQPGRCPPHVHIYMNSKQPWVKIDEDANVPTFPEFYQRSKYWPKESLERWKIANEKASKM